VEVGWSNVGDQNNAPTTFGLGAVNTKYAIGTYEVTNAQYTAFLNAVADKDTKGLYNVNMAGAVKKSVNPLGIGGITRTGKSGSYAYAVKAGWADLPVNFVSYNDTLRFINWLANGQPNGPIGAGTTETGTYNLVSSSKKVNPAAAPPTVWLPTENQWFKAAFYKGGGTNAGYWTFATGANNAPGAVPPAGGVNSANYNNSGHLTGVGAYGSSKSAYGAYDMNGNAWEWTDTAYGSSSSKKAFRGGGFDSPVTYLDKVHQDGGSKTYEAANLGFRVAGAFVEELSPDGVLTLRKFNDTNANGSKDPGEGWLQNWGFHLTGGAYDQTVYTDANGLVTLTLTKGNYNISEVPLAGAWQTTLAMVPSVVLGVSSDLLSGSRPAVITPEPVSMTMLALGSLALIRRKRR